MSGTIISAETDLEVKGDPSLTASPEDAPNKVNAQMPATFLVIKKKPKLKKKIKMYSSDRTHHQIELPSFGAYGLQFVAPVTI